MCYIKFYSSKSVGTLIKIRHGTFENVSAIGISKSFMKKLVVKLYDVDLEKGLRYIKNYPSFTLSNHTALMLLIA